MTKLYAFLNSGVFGTVVAALFALSGFVIARIIISKRIEGVRRRRRLTLRALYVSIFAFLVLLAQVWVEGFMQLLAVLSFASAALVIVNKETIMNMTGFFVIMWRGLFLEDDLIEINGNTGFVRSIGLLYFTLDEVSKYSSRNMGNTIKIPNGTITSAPIKNLTRKETTEQFVEFLFSSDSDLKESEKIVIGCVEEAIEAFTSQKNKGITNTSAKGETRIPPATASDSKIYFEIRHSKPSGLSVGVTFLCLPLDAMLIKDKVSRMVVERVSCSDKVSLSFE